MIVPSVRVQSRVPGFAIEEKSLVKIGFETNDIDIFKVHVVAEMADMACNFQWSFGQNLPLPFCALQSGSLMIFLFGHSIQNYTVCN